MIPGLHIVPLDQSHDFFNFVIWSPFYYMCDATKSGQVTKLEKIVRLPKSTLCYVAITKL